MSMAKIVLSDAAPSGQTVHFTLAVGDSFDLGGSSKKALETNNPDLLSEAAAHPWLNVEYDAADVVPVEYHDQLKPEDDAFSRYSPHANDANDAKVVLAARAAEAEASDAPIAGIEAGKDQSETVVTAGVAETVAADAAGDAKSAAAFKTTDKTDKDA